MMVPGACPRCRGTLTRIEDIGETYFSCVQCGHVVYGRIPTVSPVPAQVSWHSREATDRSEVRRRQRLRERERTARRSAA